MSNIQPEPSVMLKYMAFQSPSRCIVSISGNTKSGTVRISGRNASGQTIEERSLQIPPMPAYSSGYEIYSHYSYTEVEVCLMNLEDAEVTVGGYSSPQTSTFPAPVSCLSEQERVEIRRIAREAAQEVIREMVSEIKRKGPPVL
jgi:hypothetical protein